MTPAGFRAIFLALFAISGFAGLIYESIWSHYLKLFLGHAAYAQTLVLSIFMGGMALGSWIASRGSRRWSNLVLAYAAVELIIGLLGIVFHGVFVRVMDFAFYTALPAIQYPLLADLIKWSLGTLLILPQSVLLGMTFPLMSAGLIRRFPVAPGATLAVLYFTNSIGAAIGVLVSGFLLIGAVGLPGTILTAGLINIALAIVVWALLKRQPPEHHTSTTHPQQAVVASPFWYRLLLGIAVLTGLSSFMYEIGWMRMLALVMGASTHSFELMLSAFILGLALGGLWVRKRIDTATNPERFLAIVQIAMGGFALLSLPLYNYTFDAMGWLLNTVKLNDGGYLLFNLTSHAIAIAVMLPATFCAGMTLPLITYVLLRRGHGEQSIGAVYAANTIGAIAGVALAVHLIMPLLGLKELIVAGAVIDILLGLMLIWYLQRTVKTSSYRSAVAWTTVGTAAVVATALFADLDPLKMASGIYRTGYLRVPYGGQVEYSRDGKTSTVAVISFPQSNTLSILTNGKSDASVVMDPSLGPSSDEPTMILAAALSMYHYPDARSAAVIGMGSGLTSETFLVNPAMIEVDTIEIESAMVEGARKFSPRNDRVYSDPRSRIHIEDAKTFFSTRNRRYDIIASEPSNPWVSGTASLFTDEFYRHIRRHLRDDGIFVQWVQAYEIETPLVVTVLKALSRNFSDYALYVPGYSDILVVAKKTGTLDRPDFSQFESLGLSAVLNRIAIHSAQDLAQRRIGSRKTLGALIESWPSPYNSDFFPVLDQNAARSRFLKRDAVDLIRVADNELPILEMLGEIQVTRQHTKITPTPAVGRSLSTAVASELLDHFATATPGFQPGSARPPSVRDVDYLRFAATDCRYLARSKEWEDVMFGLARLVNGNLTAEEAQRFWTRTGLERCGTRLSDSQRNWYTLIKSVGARDATAMTRLSTELLGAGNIRSPQHAEYLLGAGMLGHLARGEREAARDLWRKYGEIVVGNRSTPLTLLLLQAHSGEPLLR